MNEQRWSRFETWLDSERELDARTIASTISTCRRVERFEGDLDFMFDNSELADLLERLTYSTEDARFRRTPKHKVPIDGNVRTGTATLKTAVRLYRDFRNASKLAATVRPATRTVREQVGRRRAEPGNWPDWPQPSNGPLRGLAQVLAPLVRFLQPEIIAAIVEDTRRHAKGWSARLLERGIDPAIYIWDGSPCAFPGVRRHAGSKEIAAFRRRSDQDALPPHCLAIDDNDIRSTCGRLSSLESHFARGDRSATSWDIWSTTRNMGIGGAKSWTTSVDPPSSPRSSVCSRARRTRRTSPQPS